MVNGATDTWAAETATQPSTSWFLKGANADVFKNALAARGMNVANDWHEEPSPSFPGKTRFLVRGPSVKHFLSFFHQLDIIHGFPPQFIKAIKDVSLVGTKVGFWFHSDRVYTGPCYGGWADYIRTRMLPYLMTGVAAKDWSASNPACAVDFTVDPEQLSPWYHSGASDIARCVASPTASPGDTSGHSWFVDFRNAAYPSAIAQAYEDMHTSYWAHGAAQPDTVMSDNLLKQFIAGQAGNEPTILSADWGNGIEDIVSAINSRMAPYGYETMWGNIGDPTRTVDYTNLKGHYWEHAFQGATIAASLPILTAGLDDLAAKGAGYKVCISYRTGSGGGVANDPMFFTPGQAEWDDIVAHADGLGIMDNCYVGFFAEGTDGVLCWQEQFAAVE
jgi:hypothetical protein